MENTSNNIKSSQAALIYLNLPFNLLIILTLLFNLLSLPTLNRINMQFRSLLPLLIAFLAMPFLMNAQVTTSRITGFVKDNKNGGLEGATIKVTNIPTGTIKVTKSQKEGRYDIPNLDAGGPYTIEVTFVGQSIPKKTDIFLQLGNTESIDFVATSTSTELENILVTSARTTRTIKNGTSSNFNQRIIATVPNISRSIANITNLTPQAGGGNSFGGRDGRYNNVQIDGANLNNNFGLSSSLLPGGAIQPISLDAIDEITVNVSPFDVRQGNFTGAGVSATTRRGTNKFQGSVYTFYRNQNYQGTKANGQKIPTLPSSTSKIFGARIGGPIIKNKLFFFISGEKEDRSAPGIVWRATRPGGTVDANTSRTLSADLDAVSSFLKTNYGYETGPYENLGNFQTSNKKILGRLDWNISPKHTASIKYNYSITDDDQLLNGTSAPNPRSASNRWSNNSMSYENSNYANTNKLSSYAFELKSNISTRLSNQLIATYTNANDPKRSSKSAIFPFIDIKKGGDSYISSGYELFSYGNEVQNNTLTINENISYNTGKHVITGGLSYEKIYVKNQFLRYGTSYYRYDSLSQFLNNQAPSAYGLTYPYAGQKPFVELDFAQFSFYAQDEMQLTNRFKLTAGLRVDRPTFQNELTANPSISALTFADLNGKPLTLDVGQWPKERNYYSPRIGFNWDVEGTKDIVIRGGVGVFTGRFPFVWFTNQPSNSGVIQNTVELTTTAALASYRFDKDPNKYVGNFPSAPGLVAPGSIAVADRNFKMPQVFRASAAVDKKLGGDWTLTIEGIYNKDINALLQYNANQKAPVGTTAGPEPRPLFGNTNALRRYNPSISEAMVLTNTSKGGAAIATIQISKRFSKNWESSIAYTHTESLDLSGNPGSQASSAWSNIPSVRGNNSLDLAYSDFGTPNRLVVFTTYKFSWAKYLATSFTLGYIGYEQGRFGYRYSNDYNQDGITSDMIYVPKNAGEITFVQNGTFTPQQQSDAFFAYIAQDKYLSKNQGQTVSRNGAKFPWFSNIDLRILQDILPISKHKNYGLQLSLDIENFTNMINNDWGVSKRTTYNNGAILAVVAAPTATTPATYRMNLVSGVLPTSTFTSNITSFDTYRMNLGLRLTF